jgi:hypothetical protein
MNGKMNFNVKINGYLDQDNQLVGRFYFFSLNNTNFAQLYSGQIKIENKNR